MLQITHAQADEIVATTNGFDMTYADQLEHQNIEFEIIDEPDTIDSILDEYRRTCWLVQPNIDTLRHDDAVTLQAHANVIAKMKLQRLIDDAKKPEK